MRCSNAIRSSSLQFVKSLNRYIGLTDGKPGLAAIGGCVTTRFTNLELRFRLIINPIQLPSSLRFVTPNQFPIFQLQIPLRARPRFFVPPVSGNQKWTPPIDDFTANICAANVHGAVFIQQDGC